MKGRQSKLAMAKNQTRCRVAAEARRELNCRPAATPKTKKLLMAASKKARASVILTWLILDYEHREMILERNQTLDEREEWDMSGLSVVAADASSSIYVITAVGSDSPAKRAGIQSNDTLVEIDGRPVRQWMLSALRGHLRQEGHRCSLVLERAGQRYAVLIQLERRI